MCVCVHITICYNRSVCSIGQGNIMICPCVPSGLGHLEESSDSRVHHSMVGLQDRANHVSVESGEHLLEPCHIFILDPRSLHRLLLDWRETDIITHKRDNNKYGFVDFKCFRIQV